MDVTEIDKQIAELQRQREEALRLEEEKNRIDGLLEGREILGSLVDALRRLDELEMVPPRLAEALKDDRGKFNPGLYIKRPKLPKGHSE